jgi:hypothetical protein
MEVRILIKEATLKGKSQAACLLNSSSSISIIQLSLREEFHPPLTCSSSNMLNKTVSLPLVVEVV